jgi:hypothetical protein
MEYSGDTRNIPGAQYIKIRKIKEDKRRLKDV